MADGFRKKYNEFSRASYLSEMVRVEHRQLPGCVPGLKSEFVHWRGMHTLKLSDFRILMDFQSFILDQNRKFISISFYFFPI